MRGIVVITGLDQLPPAERWSRLIAPLTAELADSGLGHVEDLETLQRDAAGGSSAPSEVAVDLVNLDYGRPLISRVVEDAGIQSDRGKMPELWGRFGCTDYYDSKLAKEGYWDEASQFWYVWPSDRIHEDGDRRFLVIGGPGVDGIDWGYRVDHTGVWAYYPIGQEFVWLAPTAEALAAGWRSGQITV